MDNERGTKLSDRLNDLIISEKKEGLSRLNRSGFEKRITGRIRKEKQRTILISPKLMIYASFAIVVAAVSIILLFNNGGQTGKGENPLMIVLENIMEDENKVIKDSGKSENVLSIFENSLCQVLYKVKREGISMNELTQSIAGVINSTKGDMETKLIRSEGTVRNDFRLIRHGLLYMNKKNDYTELFSRIIKNLTEG